MEAEFSNAFSQALIAAQHRRQEVDARVRQLQFELERLAKEATQLDTTIRGLEWFVDEDDRPVPAPSAIDALFAEDPVTEVEPLPQPENMRRPIASDSSPYRVGLILRDAQRPMEREEIVAEYESRGWVPADWKDAKTNISQAMRRAEKYGWARRAGDDAWTLITTQTSGAENGAGSDEAEGGD